MTTNRRQHNFRLSAESEAKLAQIKALLSERAGGVRVEGTAVMEAAIDALLEKLLALPPIEPKPKTKRPKRKGS